AGAGARRPPSGVDAATAVVTGGSVERALGRGGVLRGVEIIDGAGRKCRIACDLLAMSNGWNPALHLTTHLGVKPVWRDTCFVPDALPPGLGVAGAAGGRFLLAQALKDGPTLGRHAATAHEF